MKDLENDIKIIEERIKDPKTPQGDVKELQNKIYTLKQDLRRQKDREYESQGLGVYGSDDYAGASAGDYDFYFGYEVEKCPVKSHRSKDDCDNAECEEREWCFTATKNGKEIVRWAESEFSYSQADDIERKLILGMAKFIKEHLG